MNAPPPTDPWIARWWKTRVGQVALVLYLGSCGVIVAVPNEERLTNLPPTWTIVPMTAKVAESSQLRPVDPVWVLPGTTQPGQSVAAAQDFHFVAGRPLVLEAYCRDCGELDLTVKDLLGNPRYPAPVPTKRARRRPASTPPPLARIRDSIRLGLVTDPVDLGVRLVSFTPATSESLTVFLDVRGCVGTCGEVALVRYVTPDSAGAVADAVPIDLDAIRGQMARRDLSLQLVSVLAIGGTLFLLIVLFAFLVKEKCPSCRRTLTTRALAHREIIERSGESMLHGRVTNSGNYDRRYNTVVQRWQEGRTEKDCACSCGHQWVVARPFRRTR